MLGGVLLTGCPTDDGGTSLTQVGPGSDGSSAGDAPPEAPTTPTTGDGSEASTEPATRCGDGVQDPGEACDDANVDNTDSCLSNCESAVCGDGYVLAGFEQCDDGNASDEDSCIAGCYDATCGDGHLYAGVEDCDDGNFSAGDGCDPDCKVEMNVVECGDGELEGAEQCDDGNDDNTDSCLDTCVPYSCGDGWQHAVFEECDDANPDDTDECVNKDGACVLASCGDGFLHDGVEMCDDGNLDDTDAGVGACVPATCGDAFVQAGVEVCDDGKNAGSYNGCNPGCVGLGPRCADGQVDAPIETCDDGNLMPGDGCDETCQSELPPECLGYTELKETDRMAAFNDGPGKVTKCDSKTADKWHRFVDPAGTVMPLVPPTPYSCGTDAPGWMDGDYPTVDAGIVPRTACFAWQGDPCTWTLEISVRNCGAYYVFKLPSVPECALRYCAAPM